MNDRFKFRVWNKEQQKLYSWDDLKKSKGDNSFYWCMLQAQNDEKNNILMQCTGLKDKNGKLIYEGDILGGTYGNLYVHYCDKCKQFQLKANDYGCMACEGDIHWCELVEDENELEVIGNIYENKELLEDTDER